MHGNSHIKQLYQISSSQRADNLLYDKFHEMDEPTLAPYRIF